MGLVVSALATGVEQNIGRDFINQVNKNRPLGNDDLYNIETSNTRNKNKVFATSTDITIQTETQKQIIYGKKINNTRGRKRKDNAHEQSESKEDPEDFFHDFFSSIDTTLLVSENILTDHKNSEDTTPAQEHIGTQLKDLSEDPEGPGLFNSYDDSFLPIINLLPRLTEDLAALQRRPSPAWFKKSYTNTATVQKIYQPKAKCTPIRR